MPRVTIAMAIEMDIKRDQIHSGWDTRVTLDVPVIQVVLAAMHQPINEALPLVCVRSQSLFAI
jgi:hypothetical protein